MRALRSWAAALCVSNALTCLAGGTLILHRCCQPELWLVTLPMHRLNLVSRGLTFSPENDAFQVPGGSAMRYAGNSARWICHRPGLRGPFPRRLLMGRSNPVWGFLSRRRSQTTTSAATSTAVTNAARYTSLKSESGWSVSASACQGAIVRPRPPKALYHATLSL
jgi:hypothetical protein